MMTNIKQFLTKFAVFCGFALLVCFTWNIPAYAADFEIRFGSTVYQLSGAQTLKYFTGSPYAFENTESQLGVRYYLRGSDVQYDANFLFRDFREINGKTYLQFDCTVPGDVDRVSEIIFYAEPNLPNISGIDFEIVAPDNQISDHAAEYVTINTTPSSVNTYYASISSGGRVALPFRWRWEDSLSGELGFWDYCTITRVFFQSEVGNFRPYMWNACYNGFQMSEIFYPETDGRTNFTIMVGCPKIWWGAEQSSAININLQQIYEQLGGGGHLTPEGVATVTSMENRVNYIESDIYSHFSEEENLLENAISGAEQGASAVSSAFGEIAEGSFDRVNLFGWLAPLTAFVLIPCLFLVIFYIFRR